MKNKGKILGAFISFLMVMMIMPMTTTQVSASTVETKGDFTVTGETGNYSFDETNRILTITGGGDLTIANTNPNTATTDTIVVEDGITADITLNGVNIDVSGELDVCAFDIQGTATADITLADGSANILKSGYEKAGLQVQTGATVSLYGSGSLTATGGDFGAGIGGGTNGAGGNITISDTATVTATGGEAGAGIGGGWEGTGGNITISGSATVSSTGGEYGAGIGGGVFGVGGTVTISDTANVTATGGDYAAGIGGGRDGAGGTVTIADTLEYATSTTDTFSAFTAGTGTEMSNFPTAKYAKVKPFDLTVTGGTKGEDYTYQNGVLEIIKNATLTISGTTTKDRVVVANGVTANITLQDVNIDVSEVSNGCAFDIQGTGEATITLADGSANTLASGYTRAGLQVQAGATVSIYGSGSLDVTGGAFGAGIGGGDYGNGGTITISDSATVTATGGEWGAGIGGGYNGAGGNITISDTATLNATSGDTTVHGTNPGAGIGGGYDGLLGTVQGGTVTIADTLEYATSTTDTFGAFTVGTGAAINFPTAKYAKVKAIESDPSVSVETNSIYLREENNVNQYSRDNSIWNNYIGEFTITGTGTATTHTVTVQSGTHDITLSGVNIDVSGELDVCAFDIQGTANITLADGSVNTLKSGAAKAGLQVQTNATVSIYGSGSLTATGGTNGAGIGGGNTGAGGNITISGTASVTAKGGYDGAGIGGGIFGDGGSITISGSATVTAIGGDYCAGIGGGAYGAGGEITISGTATVTAIGGSSSAGIGGGSYSTAGGNITINDTPTITAIGGGGFGNGLLGLHDKNNSIAIPNTLTYAMSDTETPTTRFTLGTSADVDFNKQFVKIEPSMVISFDANGGSETMENGYAVKDTQYTLPENGFTAPTGKAFDKWDAGQVGDKITITADIVITAIWKDIQNQDLQFTNTSMTKTMGDAKFTNTLTGAKTTVTYTSTNEDVATVDANGEVTILKAGTTTIVATAKETDEYSGKTVQYSLLIEEKAPTSFEDIKDFIASFDVDFNEIAKIIFNNVELKLEKIDEKTYRLSGYPSGDSVIIGTAVDGSVIVTLNAEFLKTLPQGNYSLSVTTLSAPNTPVATLTVSVPQAPIPVPTVTPNPPSTTPETGDDFNPALWISVAAASLVVVMVFVRKKLSN